MTAFLHADSKVISTEPITAVDLQRRAVELAGHLSSLQKFLEASQYLSTCSRLSPSDFRRHDRKIIRLTEIARATLIGAGVGVHTFTSCSASFAPYKSAYFKILFSLRERRNDFSGEVIDRLNRLLLPLSTQMVILRKGEYPIRFGNHLWRTKRSAPTMPHDEASVRSGTSGSNSPRKNQLPIISMPPPDAFQIMTGRNTERVNRGRLRRRLPTIDIQPTRPPPICRSSTPSPEREQENIVPSAFVRPLRRRFGIFCTSKNSMYECRERDGRSARVAHE